MHVDVGLEKCSLVTDLFAIKTRILKFLPIPISITSALKRQNNESALDSQQMLNLQEKLHRITAGIQQFGMFRKKSLATMFPVTIGRTFDTMETDPNKKKKIHVVTSHLCSPALTKISEMNYWLLREFMQTKVMLVWKPLGNHTFHTPFLIIKA